MESNSKNDNNSTFDEIMVQIGYSGQFQTRFNIIYNFIFVFFATMASFNIIIALAEPDHWCYVPGRETTNFSLDEWKTMTIPSTNNTTGKQFSKCEMYNSVENGSEVVECVFGWEYDNTYYENTIPSQEDWVCANDMRVTNSLVLQRIGEILGTFIFGQMGDVYGRRPVFYASLMTLLVGRMATIISSNIYPLFVISLIFGNLSGLSVFQSCLVISMEISSDADRAHIALLQCVSWTFGLCLVPFIFWFVRDWIPFMIISTFPLLLFLFLNKYLIESPRWLASKGRMKECLFELRKIAKINKTELPDKILMSFNKETFIPENVYGVMGLFSSWQIAKKSVLVIIGWTCNMMLYMILFLNVNNLGGNPFLNYFWQGFAELPGYFIGKYLCDIIGRKFTRLGSFLITASAFIVLSVISSDSSNQEIVIILAISLKLLCSCQFYAINLHTLEIFPTCLRQTGTSIGYLIASIFGLFSPYIIYLGTSLNPSYPYIISVIFSLIGGFFGIFLPETLNERLPETLAEAEMFGKDQKFFTFPKRRNNRHSVIIDQS